MKNPSQKSSSSKSFSIFLPSGTSWRHPFKMSVFFFSLRTSIDFFLMYSCSNGRLFRAMNETSSLSKLISWFTASILNLLFSFSYLIKLSRLLYWSTRPYILEHFSLFLGRELSSKANSELTRVYLRSSSILDYYLLSLFLNIGHCLKWSRL